MDYHKPTLHLLDPVQDAASCCTPTTIYQGPKLSIQGDCNGGTTVVVEDDDMVIPVPCMITIDGACVGA